MPGTYQPAQMFDHELNMVKGWPSPYAIDKTKTIDPRETADIPAGRCCYITDNDAIAMGCPYSYLDELAPMPMWAWPSSSDLDVRSDVGNISGGNMTCLPAKGAYEMETTEYAGVGFVPNAPLCVDSGDTTPGDRGKVKVGTLSLETGAAIHDEDLIVGVVSDAGPLTNSFRKTMVRFWPVYLPVRRVYTA